MSDDDPEGQPASDDAADDARWLAALAGRGHETGNIRVEREAALMRGALRRWTLRVDPVEGDDPARIARLIERARRELRRDAAAASTVAAPRPLPVARRRSWWAAVALHPFGATFAAIGLLLVVLGTAWTVRSTISDPGEQAVRGASDPVIVVSAADPEALRDELVSALSGQGVHATIYRRFGRLGLDADLPQPPPDALRALLDRHRIPIPVDGVLRVEIEPRRQ